MAMMKKLFFFLFIIVITTSCIDWLLPDLYEDYVVMTFRNKSTKELVIEVRYVDYTYSSVPYKIEFYPIRYHIHAGEYSTIPLLAVGSGPKSWKYLFESGCIGDTILVAIDGKWENIEKWEKTLDKSFVDTVLILTEKEAPPEQFWEVIYKPE